MLGDLPTKRAHVENQDSLPGDMTVIYARAPLAEVARYAAQLGGMTQGQRLLRDGTEPLRNGAGQRAAADRQQGAAEGRGGRVAGRSYSEGGVNRPETDTSADERNRAARFSFCFNSAQPSSACLHSNTPVVRSATDDNAPDTVPTSPASGESRMNAVYDFFIDEWYFSVPLVIMSLVAAALVIWRLLLNNVREHRHGRLPAGVPADAPQEAASRRRSNCARRRRG